MSIINILLMIAAALAPAVILAMIIIRRDPGEPEPRKWLLGAAGLGVIAAALSGIAEMNILPGFETTTPFDAIIEGFCCAAIPEECFKLLMLYIVAKRCEKFNEYFDGIIYAVCIGMGFAGIENVGYLAGEGSGWIILGIVRAIISVPGHYFDAVLMGAFFSLAWFDPKHRTRNAILALVAPIVAHGIFDSLIMVRPVLENGAFLALFLFFFFLRRLRRYASKLVNDRIALDKKSETLEAAETEVIE